MNLKKFFIKHLLIITILFPLLIILFYGFLLSLALQYKHVVYTKQELSRYENDLRKNHKNFLQEKSKYLESFMRFLYSQNLQNNKQNFKYDILHFIESLKKYDSGFIFIFKKDGTLIKHPCATTFVGLNSKESIENHTIVDKFIKASKSKKFVYYQGTDCIEEKFVKKIAYVHHIRQSDLYIVISKNEKEIRSSIEKKRILWQEKIDDELQENIKLLSIVSLISIFFSLIFSRIINILLKDYEQRLKENNKIMFAQSRLAQAGELLSMISHQWRQPISKIASISSNLRFELMIKNNINFEILDKKLNNIEDYTEFLSETIDDFKNFYKPKQEKDLSFIIPLINKAINLLENELIKKNINIIKNLDKDSELNIYSNELIQVIVNIIQNAIEFSRKHSTITIDTEVTKHTYIITITDEAGGIKDEHINKIFDAHFSTKINTSNNLGLGLYVSKVIIEKHFYGQLEVKSENKHSTFTIRLGR